MNLQHVQRPDATLPVFSYIAVRSTRASPSEAYLDRAWAAALTLIVIVMVLNLLARTHREDVRTQDQRPLSRRPD